MPLIYSIVFTVFTDIFVHFWCTFVPGCSVYFTAQASHLAHLARKLEAAVDQAMKLSEAARTKMVGDALAKRFPAAEMMESYGQAWVKVNFEASCRLVRVQDLARH